MSVFPSPDASCCLAVPFEVLTTYTQLARFEAESLSCKKELQQSRQSLEESTTRVQSLERTQGEAEKALAACKDAFREQEEQTLRMATELAEAKEQLSATDGQLSAELSEVKEDMAKFRKEAEVLQERNRQLSSIADKCKGELEAAQKKYDVHVSVRFYDITGCLHS